MPLQGEGGVILRWGEVVSRDESGFQIRLDDGAPAVVPFGETPQETLGVGDRGQFRVEGADTAGRITLSLVSIAGAGQDSQHAFDREVHRLHRALSSHGPVNRRTEEQVYQDALGEERINQWVQRVEAKLVDLRKHRSKRLNEQI